MCPFVLAARMTELKVCIFYEGGRHRRALTGVLDLDYLSLMLVLNSVTLTDLRRLWMRT